MPRGLLKRITTRDSSAVGIHRAMNGLEVSTVGTRWKFTSVSVNCGQDISDIVGHAAQDRVGDGLGRIPACRLVAVDFLDPFQVDHRHDPDLQVGVTRRR